jgi:hypothetical protein
MATTEKANNKRYTQRDIVDVFPELAQSFLHPVSGRQTSLANVIMSMNDHLDWSRENIADWLCRVGDCKHEIKGGELPLRRVIPKSEIFSNYHKLAETMRVGSLLRPKKIKGAWKSGTTGACAMGAVAEGAGFKGNRMPWETMWKMFPELKSFMRHPLTKLNLELWSVISSLSEATNFSREQIADWLCVESGCTHPVQTNGLNNLGLVA